MLDDLIKEELRAWSIREGTGHHRRTCPVCSKDRKNSKVECLSVTVDADKALLHCWHCELKGAIRLVSDRPKPFSLPVKTPPPAKTTAIKEIGTSLDAISKTYLKNRGISERTAQAYGVVTARAYFLNIRRETPAIAFPYYEGDKVHGHKARSTEEKDHVCHPALYSLFGIQNVDLKESGDFLICEGELDALSMSEAGILNATSVPNGASSFSRSGGDDERATYAFLWSAKKKIDQAKRILIATDADDPGQKLADEIARRIGRHRCWRVTFPEGCKDANDVLLKKGEAELRKCVESAEPWPIDGLYEATQFFPAVFDLFENGFGERVRTGIASIEELYSVGPGLLTIVTGIPGNGKSTFVDQLMVNLARTKDWTFGICSFENPPHVHIAKISEMLLQKHFFETDLPGDKMTSRELEGTLPFINQHFKFLQQDDGKKATLESIIERIKTAVFRWGIQGAVVDPYNYIQRPKSATSETEWIDDMLTQLRLLASVHGLHLWFVAHPTKLPMDTEGNTQPPRGYSISGSAAWYSKADFGLTVHRVPNEAGKVKIINWKTRFDWLGREGEATILYDNTTNVYLSDPFTDMLPMDGQKGYNYRDRYADD